MNTCDFVHMRRARAHAVRKLALRALQCRSLALPRIAMQVGCIIVSMFFWMEVSRLCFFLRWKFPATALLSTQEAEYVALSEATKEALCLRMLLLHLGFGDRDPRPLIATTRAPSPWALRPSSYEQGRRASCRHARAFLPTARRGRQCYHSLLLYL